MLTFDQEIKFITEDFFDPNVVQTPTDFRNLFNVGHQSFSEMFSNVCRRVFISREAILVNMYLGIDYPHAITAEQVCRRFLISKDKLHSLVAQLVRELLVEGAQTICA
jgi:hypothetical protein